MCSAASSTRYRAALLEHSHVRPQWRPCLSNTPRPHAPVLSCVTMAGPIPKVSRTAQQPSYLSTSGAQLVGAEGEGEQDCSSPLPKTLHRFCSVEQGNNTSQFDRVPVQSKTD